MPASLSLILVVAGFGLITAIGAWLGAGSHLSLAGLFPARGRIDWPRGLQESDTPRFAVAHLDALRPETRAPDTPEIEELSAVTGAPAPRIVEVQVPRVGRRSRPGQPA